MLMKNPPSRYRAMDIRPARRRTRWGLLISCLPLTGLLVTLFMCGLVGLGASLVWLMASPETSRTTHIQRLRPLPLPTLTPTVLPAAHGVPAKNEAEPANPVSPDPGQQAAETEAESRPDASPSPLPSATVSGASAGAVAVEPTGADNSAPADSVAAAVTPSSPPAAAAPPGVTPAPTVAPTATPSPADLTAPAAAGPEAAPVPDWWQGYMQRVQQATD